MLTPKLRRHLINMLSDTWQEKRLARLAKFLKAPYVSPDTLSHESLELRNEIVKTMLHEAQRRRTIVVNAIMQETRAKRGVGRWTKLSDTLGYEDLDEF